LVLKQTLFENEMTQKNPLYSGKRSGDPVFERFSDDLTLAVSTQWYVFPEKFDWLSQHGFGMEYAPNFEQFHLIKEHLNPYIEKQNPVRHHGYFPGFEFGNTDAQKAEQALQLHMRLVDAVQGCGEPVMTVHVGLPPFIELNHKRVIQNLTRLVEYSRERGVTICLENLRKGPTSNPEIVIDWAEKSGSSITMDIGHAVSCERVTNGDLNVPDIVRMFSHLLEEVHFYESETDKHHAPKNMSVLGPVIDQLLKTNCRWWTIELDAYDEILTTQKLIYDYLADKAQPLAA